MAEEKNVIAMLLDENNIENVIIHDVDDNAVEFEQIAIIPYNEKIYAILRPVDVPEGMDEDEAFVFCIELSEEEETAALVFEEDDAVIEAVFDEYNKMCDEDEAE